MQSVGAGKAVAWVVGRSPCLSSLMCSLQRAPCMPAGQRASLHQLVPSVGGKGAPAVMQGAPSRPPMACACQACCMQLHVERRTLRKPSASCNTEPDREVLADGELGTPARQRGSAQETITWGWYRTYAFIALDRLLHILHDHAYEAGMRHCSMGYCAAPRHTVYLALE